jgi:hypothetical protein
MERFNLKKLNEIDGKEQYSVEISDVFTVWAKESDMDINSAWETVRDNIKISAKESGGYYELKKYKPWFGKVCSELLDERKEAKLQWLQDASKINGDNLNSVRC